jgi:anaerobic selenocysteine-containing dehydrogenase
MSAAANATEWLARALEVITGSADRRGGTLFNPGYATALDTKGKLPTPISTRAPGPASRPELASFGGELPVSAAIDEIDAGNLRALVVLGGNPVTSFPETRRLLAALDRLDVLAVADVATTDTTELATHVLPCTGPLERADVPYFVEMLYPAVATHYTPAVVAPAFERKPAGWIVASLAERLGAPILPEPMTAASATDDDVLALLFASSRRSFAAVRAEERCMVVGPPPPGWVTTKVLPGGRWDVAPEELVEQLPLLHAPTAPVLIARRQPRHLNSQLRTIAARGAQRDEAVALLSTTDAAERDIRDGDTVEIASAAGSLVVTARVDDRLRTGALSLPHGWHGDLGPNVSELTSATRDVDALTGMIRQTALPVTITRLTERVAT